MSEVDTGDIYLDAACFRFNKEPEKVSREERKYVKDRLFAVMYGQVEYPTKEDLRAAVMNAMRADMRLEALSKSKENKS